MSLKMKMKMRMEMRKRPKIRTMFQMILPAIAGARDLCDPNVPASACEYRTCKTLHPHENTQTSQNINKHRARNIKENANFLFQAISMAAQRGNVASILGTSPNTKKLDEIYYL